MSARRRGLSVNKLFLLIRMLCYGIVLGCCFSCCEEQEDPYLANSIQKQSFLTETSEGLYLRGIQILVFSEAEFQQALSPKRRMYRLQDDVQQRYAQFVFLDYPRSEGTVVNVVCEYVVGELRRNQPVPMLCAKIQGEFYWFWNDNERMGIVVPAAVFE